MYMTSKPDVFRQTNLATESSEYIVRRDQLRLAEIELMRHQEKVAEMRRRLPQGPEIQDYVFEEGPADLKAGDSPIRNVRISELFTAPDRALIVYHFMFGKKNTKPCPMCTAWIDCMNGVAHHLAQNVDLVIVAAADPAALRAHARVRGWNKLRLLSAGMNSFKYDLGSEDRDGNQDSEVSVFVQDPGKIRHFYSGHPRMSPEIKERGLDLLNPIWNVLDLTPHGRGDFYASLAYGAEIRGKTN
jgi:predicted dithiol-disulfide oxidoreductase (DUF899 family)